MGCGAGARQVHAGQPWHGRGMQSSPLTLDSSIAPVCRLDVVTKCPGMKRCLAALLVREAVGAAGLRGKDFEARSVLAPLLSVSTLPTWTSSVMQLTFPAKECFMQLRRALPGRVRLRHAAACWPACP